MASWVRSGAPDSIYRSVVSTDRASALAFYRFQLEARAASGNIRFRRLRSAIVESNLAPHFQACFIVVGQKC